MRSLNDTLRNLFQSLHIEDRMQYASVVRAWHEAVGEQIRGVTAPASLRRGVLYVTVASSVWMQQLVFLKEDILCQVNARLGSSRLTDIRFRIGHVPVPHREGEDALPVLSDEELQRIHQQTAAIHDPDLRQTFQRVIAAHFRNRKNRDG